MTDEITKDKPDNIAKMLENIEPRILFVEGSDIGTQVLLVPNGMKAEGIKKYLDEHRLFPERRKDIERTDRLQSFIDLTNRFKSEDSVVFAKGTIKENSIEAKLTTVFDYHPANSNVLDAQNKGHRVDYNFPVSKEFQFWLRNNGEALDQTDFALLLEEHILEMVIVREEEVQEISGLKPKFADPLQMRELSADLEIYSSEEVRQAGKLSSGERNIRFTTQHTDADGKPISIPDFFMIQVPVFESEGSVRIPVRLRYRKHGTSIKWFYDLYRVDRVFDTAFEKAVNEVKEKTQIPLFIGSTS